METLFIDRKDAQLDISGQRLVVRRPGQRQLFTLPLEQLGQVVLAAEVELSSKVLWQLAAHRIGLIALHPRHGEQSALLLPFNHGAVQRRLAQYRWTQAPELCVPMANALIRVRIWRMERLLRQALALRPEMRTRLLPAARQLSAQRLALRRAPQRPEALLGCEGSAAARYFSAYADILPSSWGFSGRNRRPPKDPVNAMLSLGFTLLTAEVTRRLVGCGLDPFLGFYHRPSYGRPSLACDLSELFRDRVEHWVWRAFAEQVFRPDHFGHQGRACLLNKTGRGVFFEHWYRWFPGLSREIRRACRRLAGGLGDLDAGMEE